MSGSKAPRVGMSKRDNPRHLLTKVGGKEVQGAYTKVERLSNGAILTERPEDASPEASSDEENQKPPMKHDPDTSDSEHDNRNVDIVKTQFDRTTKSSTAALDSGLRKSTRFKTDTKNATSSSRPGFPSMSAGSQRPEDDFVTNSGAHFKDSMGFLRGQNKSKVKNGRVPKGYGKSSQRTSAKLASKRSRSEEDDPPPRKFKRPSTPPSPQQPRGSGFRQLSVTGSSPVTRPKFKAENLVLDDSPEKSKPRFVHPDGEDGLGSSREIKGANRRSARAVHSREQRHTRNRKKSLEIAAEDLSQRPVFKMPDEELEEQGHIPKGMPSTQALNLFVSEQNELDFGSDSSLSDVILDDLDGEETQAFAARCPMCHGPVDAEFLKRYTARGRMNVSKQAAFCRAHKQKTAQETRVSRGYPEVDWDALESRFRKQEDALRDILEATRSSFYAGQLSEVIESGKNRTLLSSDDSLTPGYYGPRGQRVMTDFVMRTFSDTLRQRAIKDRLVSARGYSGYVQAVLVPELAVRLIMEDMSVTEEAARQIMGESSELGEFLHEEVRDVVESDSQED